jgi:manganese oxidase
MIHGTLRRWRRGAVLLLPLIASGCQAPSDLRPVVRPNDNRTAAGLWRGDTLMLQLEVHEARWYPESDSGPFIDAPAFAQVGRAPQIPAPLIRVREGAMVAVTVRNALRDSSLTVHGLATRPASEADSIVVKPGETRELRFQAGAPGTYFYRATAGHVNWKVLEREQLAGAFIVDSAGATPDDRVFVINIYGDVVDSVNYRNALAINGKSWPHTERLEATVGDTLRWRVINASIREHPMHLHGFYYRVDARGDARRDTIYADSARRLVVTELMNPGETRAMVWTPERDGNWLFHCHLAFHVIPEAGLDRQFDGGHHMAALSHDVGDHMAGLILGIHVAAPPGWVAPARGEAERLWLHVNEGPKRGRSPRAMGYVLQDGELAPARDSLPARNPLLVMHRGRPADIAVINNLSEPTAVHWHGIELESYSDGVPGWSGSASRLAPSIAPGDTFVARLTFKRAGTFIYHTHLGDLVQITSGLFGGLIVLEPGERFDPATDHVYVAGWDGPADPRHLVINGDSVGGAVRFAHGKEHRLRFINIGPAAPLRAKLTRNGEPVTWRAIAIDGADLPESQRVTGPAEMTIDVGQTADFAFRPPSRGNYVLALIGSKRAPPIEFRIRVP